MKKLKHMKKKLAAIGALVIILLVNVVNVVAQDNKEENLPCLAKVYAVNAGEVLLDCKPEESKRYKGKVSWVVAKLNQDRSIGEIIKGAIVKKHGDYYLDTNAVYKEMPNQDVVLVFILSSDEGGYVNYSSFRVVGSN